MPTATELLHDGGIVVNDTKRSSRKHRLNISSVPRVSVQFRQVSHKSRRSTLAPSAKKKQNALGLCQNSPPSLRGPYNHNRTRHHVHELLNAACDRSKQVTAQTPTTNTRSKEWYRKLKASHCYNDQQNHATAASASTSEGGASWTKLNICAGHG